MNTKPQFQHRPPLRYSTRLVRLFLGIAVLVGVILWLYAMALMAGVSIPPLDI